MIYSDRVRARMGQQGLSQSELARRVGVTQGAIAKVAKNNPNGSSFLHLLARELRTTTGYLTGETDDPELGATSGPALSYEAQQLVVCFERLADADKAALLQIARSLAAVNDQSSHPRKIQMFGKPTEPPIQPSAPVDLKVTHTATPKRPKG